MPKLKGCRPIRVVAATLAAGALLGTAIVPAGAWPIPLTVEDTAYLSATRGAFPGNDDQLLTAGRQACRLLYTGQPTNAVVDSLAAQYAATPAQASMVVSAARGTYCTQAPG
ncbi:DUF732 domain-containing protein [Mycobacterium sp. GA-2829]|uniref:DUF732 domain-containing protein n=1 Tax=Mycobacterium sp. GA-2829 TaxID=1772283 RepID=UPI00073FC144|nr:DUF732 domain-containing protein [Mycobacterium sp. GA-2829]KUI36237.1 hypothetical protein AU194_16110 [Mycobacterium sp. GA-2829]